MAKYVCQYKNHSCERCQKFDVKNNIKSSFYEVLDGFY